VPVAPRGRVPNSVREEAILSFRTPGTTNSLTQKRRLTYPDVLEFSSDQQGTTVIRQAKSAWNNTQTV
jgi:hypothetical protein